MIPEYIISFSINKLPVENVDCLIIGAGVAGLRASLELKGFNVLIVNKESVFDSCSYNAQGGIAVSLSSGDTPQLHLEDTLKAGCFLNNIESVKILVEEGPARIKELIDWGVEFDRENSGFDWTIEAAHSVKRILHSHGDKTGQELIKTLLKKCHENSGVKIIDGYFLVDLVEIESGIYGAILFNRRKKKLLFVSAKKIILASGGASQLYQETTNPFSITGDAQSAVLRKNGVLSSMEFVQFHPTTLYLAGAPRFLISESVRGEGGTLIDKNGRPFMESYHPLKELAPRDIVSRAIIDHMKKTSSICVYLDIKKLSSSFIKKRFPGIYKTCLQYGLDITKNLIPVRPAAHYFMGGIKTDIYGKTSLGNLFACGECADAGVQGANRLASNSLLEGLVFGSRAGKTVKEEIERGVHNKEIKISYSVKQKEKLFIDCDDLRRSIKSLMWKNVGIERQGDLLKETMERIDNWARYVFFKEFSDVWGWEVQNMLILAKSITLCALRRQESRGAHYRVDFPETDDIHWKKQQTITKKDLSTDM
ncbi:MAG: L-aspartate oxidase [Candidatus Omnitrophica bacterium]|nr:L-aspartate oxidase [Candidatus Omnitrophota bacterium]